jgi:drug/metabolite transporter (DMT)-like permease
VSSAGGGRIGSGQGRPSVGANVGAATAAVLFGASVVAVRVAVQDIPPLSLAVLRLGVAAVALVIALSVFAPKLLRVPPGSLPLLVVLGAIAFTLFPITFNAGLRWTEASRGALMLATVPMWCVWLARRVAGERLAGRQLVGVVLSVLGIALAFAEPSTFQADGRALVGDGLLLVTALLGTRTKSSATIGSRRSAAGHLTSRPMVMPTPQPRRRQLDGG